MLKADLRKLRSGPLAETPLARNIESQISTLEKFSDVGLEGLDDAERLALQQNEKLLTPFDNKIFDLETQLRAVEDARGAVKGAKRNLTRQRDTKALRKEIADLKKERTVALRDAKDSLSDISDDQVNEALLMRDALFQDEINRLDDVIAKRKTKLDSMPAQSDDWLAAGEVQKTLKKKRDDLLAEIQNNKRYKKDRVAYVRDLKKKANAHAKEQLDDLKAVETRQRQGISDRMDQLDEEMKLFEEEIGMDGKVRKSLGRKATQEAIDGNNSTTKQFNDAFQAWRKNKKMGYDPMDALESSDPQAMKAILESGNGKQRVVMVDKTSYDEFMHPEKGILARLNKPDSLAKAFSWLDHMTTAWKGWMTLPPFFSATRSRDTVSNMITQFQGGVNPFGFAKQAKNAAKFNYAMRKAVGSGDFEALKLFTDIPEEVAKATGAKDGLELFEYLYSKSVISPSILQNKFALETGSQYVDVSKSIPLADVSGVKEKAKALFDNVTTKNIVSRNVLKAGGVLAETLDDQAKVMAFYQHIAQGKLGEEAASTVTKWAYNPKRAESSSFERMFLRRFIPFYSFTKFAVASQVRAAFTKPATVTLWEKVARSARTFTGLSEIEQELLLPEFIKDNFGIPTKVKDGVIHFKMFGSVLPLAEIGKISNALQDTFSDEGEGGISRELGSRMNPFIKLGIETAINESFFTQRPIEDFPGEKVDFMWGQVPAKVRNALMAVRLLNEIDRIGILDKKGLDAILSLQNPAGDRVDARGQTVGEKFSQSAFNPLAIGSRTQVRDVRSTAGFAIRAQQRNISKDRSRIRDLVEKQATSGQSEEDNLIALQKSIAKRIAKVNILTRTAQENDGQLR